MAELSSSLARLVAFRAELYACCTRRRDALLELGDALLCAQAIPSVAHLSLEPAHRRGWGSAYAALARGGIDAEQVRDLLVRHPLDEGLPIFAVDATCWARCDANCSPQRGLYYHPSRHSAGQPIVAGWAFQWIAQLSFTRDSWTAPLDARRLHPHDNHNQVAVAQIRELLDRLPTSGQVPLFVFDAGYDPTGLVLGLAEAPAAILVRLRSGRCFYADPPPRVPTVKGGRPRRHGAKLDTGNPPPGQPRTPAIRRRPPVRSRAPAGMGGAASQAAAAYHPWDQTAAADRARHPGPPAGRARACQHPPTPGAVAVVARPRHPGAGDAVAGLRAPL
jgi:DDE superfamily endonuclease